MAAANHRAVFEAFLAAANGRDVAALDRLVHPDYEEVYPQSGERTRGISNLTAIIEHYPGGYTEGGLERVVGGEDRWIMTPTFTLLRIEGSGNVFAGVLRATYPDGSDWFVVQIAEVRDEKVWRVQTFFAPHFEAPAWRAQWVQITPD
jgi:hypothetical protein